MADDPKGPDKPTGTGSKATEPKGTDKAAPATASGADDSADDSTDDTEQPAGVDPRLDNRVGDQRPGQLGELKPQQRHGGAVGDESEHEDPPSADVDAVGDHSEGPHGRGPQSGPSSED